jgi:polysaccharide biosynthesis transport protein
MENPMEISDLIRVILRRKWVVVVTALATVAAAYGYSTMQPKIYRAYAIVRVMTAVVGDNNWVDYNILYTDRLINTYTTLLGTAPVTTEIMQRLGFDTMPETTIETLPNTELLQITASDENPEHAADAANAVAEIFVNQDVNVFNTDLSSAEQSLLDEQETQQAALETFQQNLAELQAASEPDTAAISDVTSQIESAQVELGRISQELTSLQLLTDSRQGDVVLVEEASVPTVPESNSTMLFLALGLLGGGVAGVGLALGLHLLDQRMYSVQEIEAVIKQPVIARIPQITQDIPELFASSTPDPQREEIRRLCILLQQQLSLSEAEDQPGIVIMVTGYPDGKEKALIATGLAYAMAETGIKTLLVEGDLVNPSIVAPQSQSRTEDNVTEDETISAISVRWRSPYIDLSIMPGIEPVINDQFLPQFYLRLQKEIELARRSYQLVIVSTPSPLASVHSARLISLADVTLVVMQRGLSRQPLMELVSELRRFETTKLEFIESNANISNRIREYRAYWSPGNRGQNAERSINAFQPERKSHQEAEPDPNTMSASQEPQPEQPKQSIAVVESVEDVPQPETENLVLEQPVSEPSETVTDYPVLAASEDNKGAKPAAEDVSTKPRRDMDEPRYELELIDDGMAVNEETAQAAPVEVNETPAAAASTDETIASRPANGEFPANGKAGAASPASSRRSRRKTNKKITSEP